MNEEYPSDHPIVRPAHSNSGTLIRVVNQGKGVPRVLEARGGFKCLTCDGFVKDDPICQECRVAISILRAGPHSEALLRFLTVLTERPGLLTAMEALTDEAITEYFLGRIRQHREH